MCVRGKPDSRHGQLLTTRFTTLNFGRKGVHLVDGKGRSGWRRDGREIAQHLYEGLASLTPVMIVLDHGSPEPLRPDLRRTPAPCHQLSHTDLPFLQVRLFGAGKKGFLFPLSFLLLFCVPLDEWESSSSSRRQRCSCARRCLTWSSRSSMWSLGSKRHA